MSKKISTLTIELRKATEDILDPAEAKEATRKMIDKVFDEHDNSEDVP